MLLITLWIFKRLIPRIGITGIWSNVDPGCVIAITRDLERRPIYTPQSLGKE
jgi:hypothetical protein